MPHLAINDIHMYYEEEGSGTPLVLLHGGLGTIDSDAGWSKLRPTFAGKYRAIFVEHRGHGRTDSPVDAFTYGMLVDDARELIHKLDIAPTHIAGMSDGAITALGIGLAHPELALTITCVGANYKVDDTIRNFLSYVTPEVIGRENPAWKADMEIQHDTHKYPGYWKKLLDQVIGNARVNPSYSEEDLRRISVPTLLIDGDNDPFGNLDQMVAMRRNIPDSEMLIVNNAGHIVQHTHPYIVGPAMMDFLARRA